jgi:hypothetical protein
MISLFLFSLRKLCKLFILFYTRVLVFGVGSLQVLLIHLDPVAGVSGKTMWSVGRRQ